MATRGIVPRADNEGSLGTTLKKWATGFIKILTVDTVNLLTLTAQAIGFSISGGTTSKTLTVEDDSLINQDLTTDASPTFATAKLTSLTDGYVPKHSSDSAGLVDSNLYKDASGNTGIGTTSFGTSAAKVIALAEGTAPTTSPADAIQLWSANHLGTAGKNRLHLRTEDGTNGALAILDELVKAAKGRMINDVYSIVTPANVRLFLVFDQSGAVSTITDRSSIGGTTAHVVTLRDGSLNAINASTMSPAVSGLCPNLTFSSSALWNTPDADDLSFGNGSADSAFSIVGLINRTSDSSMILGKYDNTAGSTKREYFFYINSNILTVAYYDESSSARIGRIYSASLSGDKNTWRCYAATKSSGITSSAINLYRDGINVDDGDTNTGAYTAMENTAALCGSYILSVSGSVSTPTVGSLGALIIVAGELTAVQVARLDAVLRAYAGVAL